jgi:hypothetical protein
MFSLTLTLFVAGIGANNPHDTFAADHFATFTNSFN